MKQPIQSALYERPAFHSAESKFEKLRICLCIMIVVSEKHGAVQYESFNRH